MIKIGITGSIASGKTTASKILSYKKGPLFSADKVVKSLYKKNNFKKLLAKKFNIEKKIQFKIFTKKKNLKQQNKY
ncbi:dephospho-CoA kinase [Pelagibacteraceae bacterium]|nr:dephospho-CoA kinase [Pelagibacteraceae bacterium]